MKHYLRFMLVLLLSTVWCVGGYSQETVTFMAGTDKGSKTNTGSISSDKMSKDGVTISSTRALLGTNPYKFYKKTQKGTQPTTEITVESGNIIKIVFKGTDTGKPVSGFNVIGSNGSYECSDNVGTWTGNSNKVTFNNPPYNGDQVFVSSIEVTYETKTLTSLAISGTPTITTYYDGGKFDPTGLEVTGTYDDNSTATITNGIKWTMTPETLAVGNTSCSVTATVNGVTSKPYEVTGLTVVKPSKPIVFDFTANPNVWKITPLANNEKEGNNVIAGKNLEVDGVVMTATNGSNSGTCIFKSTSSVSLRVYTGGGSITFTAPEGYNLSNVTFDFDNKGTFTTSEQTWKSPIWTGNAHAVTFTCTKNIQVNTATIKLVAATPVTPEVTSGTIEFKAVDNDIYYATFSSDKDVVFYKDLDVFGVSVAGGKISQNSLTKGIYNVTDATAGEDKDGAVEGFYVPANTGVLLVCLDKSAPYYFPETSQTVTLPANQLKPAPIGGVGFTAETGYKYYKLAYDNYTAQTGLGFYWGEKTGGAFNVKAGTAYLAVPASEANNAKGFAFDGETTGIENVNVAANQSKIIYNLNGQRVSNMSQAGLYIVNGKKVVIRK